MRSRLSTALGVAGFLLAASGWTTAMTAQGVPAQAPPAAPGRAALRPAPPRPAAPSTAPAPRTTSPSSLRGGASAGARPSSIQGAAWQSNNAPVPKAMLRLRNVITGKLQDTTVANEAGNFAFNTVPEGTYVIEVVTQSGKILMVGQTFTVAPGETVATFVRLGPKIPWFNGFFNNAASAVSSSAASTGVTAIAPEEIPPVSAVR